MFIETKTFSFKQKIEFPYKKMKKIDINFDNNS